MLRGQRIPLWLAVALGALTSLLVLVSPRLALASTVGFCDVRGATGVAPLPAIPADPTTLDADDRSSCDDTVAAGVALEGRESPAQQAADGHDVDPAAVPELPRIPRHAVTGGVRGGHGVSELPTGFGRRVEHPPRR